MKKRGVGIMSGTSMDGIDVVIADLKGHKASMDIKVVASFFMPYSEDLFVKVKNLTTSMTVEMSQVCSLNVELSEAFSDAVKKCLKKHAIAMNTIDFVAMHGQTVYHIGENSQEGVASSLQLGDPVVLGQRLGIPVVSNFRQADIAQGGQGAPLVPYADYVLFSKLGEDIALHNLGGISNVTVVPKSKNLHDILAFDTGPANMMIDAAMLELFDKRYDHEGRVARRGAVFSPLLAELMHDEFLSLQPPKSTGRERYGFRQTLKVISRYLKRIPPEDIVATLTEFTARSIAKQYELFILPHYNLKRVVFSGGGARNIYLLERIKFYLPTLTVECSSAYGIDESEKEALAFCILAHETLVGHSSNIPSATGAKKSVVLGTVYRP